MTRSPLRSRPLAPLGLAAALVAYVGCNSSPTPDRPATTPTKPGAQVKASTPGGPSGPRKPFSDWPDPAGALVVSGEQLGYLEPCGCTEGQLGGLLRRYEMVGKLRDERHWPLALVDLGSLVKDPATARGGPDQTKIKFNAALKALSLLKYDALALSPEDLKLGTDEVVGQFLNLPAEAPKVVAANVTAPGLEQKVVPAVRTKAGSVKLGVTAVVDPESLKALKDPALEQLLQVKPVEESLPGVLAGLEKDTDVQVLLVQGKPELARALGEKYPGFDVVVGTSSQPDPKAEPERLNGGKTLLVNVGQRGKYTGVVGFFPGSEPPVRYERVTLNPTWDGPAGPMKAVVEDEYRSLLKAQGVAAGYPKHGYVAANAAASGSTFVGAETCKVCHPNTFARWSTTKHALAYVSLEKDRKPNTVFDAECVTCHTTGFEYTSGWVSPDKTAYLKGNQCENCHGPASKHVAEPDNKDLRDALHLTAELADKNRLCLRCHDEDNSPHFDFTKYWGQVIHNKLDTYNDPKVHRGITPRIATRPAQ